MCQVESCVASALSSVCEVIEDITFWELMNVNYVAVSLQVN